MKSKKDIYAQVDEKGRLVLPSEVSERYGLRPGEKVPLTEQDARISIRQSVNHLTKIYIEPTNKCNLSCRICVRHSWDERLGDMDAQIFGQIIAGLQEFSSVQTAVLGGFGEPLMHVNIADMTAQLKKKVSTVELITNGILLNEDKTKELLAAGLDVLWISLDGATPEKYNDVRQGSFLTEIIQNVENARDLLLPEKRHIGIVFVAMRSNVGELPDVISLGRKLGADRFLITNVVPYTEEMCEELLYSDVQSVRNYLNPSILAPHVNLPKMDVCDISAGPLYRIIRGFRLSNFSLDDFGNHSDYCPFVERGTVSIGWDGAVSPCLPLIHSYNTFLNHHRRTVHRCTFGNLKEKSLNDIWEQSDYITLRERVKAFDFSPCSQCGGCHLSKENKEDCFGNNFPTCGGCLWAQGLVRCP